MSELSMRVMRDLYAKEIKRLHDSHKATGNQYYASQLSELYGAYLRSGGSLTLVDLVKDKE